MGGSESSYGNRKVSFGLDDHEQIRVLQGIRLSEDVVNRMKAPPRRDQRPSSFGSTTLPQASEGECSAAIHPPSADSLGRKPSEAEEDLYRRYEQEQALVQEELVRLAKREQEAAREGLKSTLQREQNSTTEEKQRAAQLPADLDAWARELETKEEELKRRDAFFKEQLARIEKKNAEIYKLTSEQFHEEATNAENHIKLRNVEPLCAKLQTEILKCYKENKHQVLNCSELAKEYQRCVSAAQKELLVNYG